MSWIIQKIYTCIIYYKIIRLLALWLWQKRIFAWILVPDIGLAFWQHSPWSSGIADCSSQFWLPWRPPKVAVSGRFLQKQVERLQCVVPTEMSVGKVCSFYRWTTCAFNFLLRLWANAMPHSVHKPRNKTPCRSNVRLVKLRPPKLTWLRCQS